MTEFLLLLCVLILIIILISINFFRTVISQDEFDELTARIESEETFDLLMEIFQDNQKMEIDAQV
jgi:hypothetical protein